MSLRSTNTWATVACISAITLASTAWCLRSRRCFPLPPIMLRSRWIPDAARARAVISPRNTRTFISAWSSSLEKCCAMRARNSFAIQLTDSADLLSIGSSRVVLRKRSCTCFTKLRKSAARMPESGSHILVRSMASLTLTPGIVDRSAHTAKGIFSFERLHRAQVATRFSRLLVDP